MMGRLILYFIIVVLAGTGFAWLANYSGDVVMTIGSTRVVISLFTASCALVALVLAILFIWWFLKTIVTSPAMFKRHIAGRRKDRGYQALTSGLLAVMSGDSATARRMVKQSSKLLDANREPLLQWLEVETRLLDLDRQGAVRLFEQMRENPQTQLLGLKGLYREAVKSGALEAASQYAAEAAKLNPSLKWASSAALEQLGSDGAWKEAIELFSAYEKAQPKAIAKDENLTHHRVVLMSGQARDTFELYPDEARRIALKAHKLEPSFVPAANIAGQILFKLGELRKGSKLIEGVWRSHPHPDLALSYINAVSGDSALERYKRARQLARINPGHRESLMIVARAAFEAGEYEIARKNALKIVNEKPDPTERTFLLLADIEAAQNGNQGEIRSWLARAVQAAPDPIWIADGMMLPEWVAISPITGKLDACVWTSPAKKVHRQSLEAAPVVPLEELELQVRNDKDDVVEGEVVTKESDKAADVKAPASKPAPARTDIPATGRTDIKDAKAAAQSKDKQQESTTKDDKAKAGKVHENNAVKAGKDADIIDVVPDDAPVRQKSEALEDVDQEAGQPVSQPRKANKSKRPVLNKGAIEPPILDAVASDDRQDANEPITRLVVDDPGVEQDEDTEKKKNDGRFRLF